MERLLNVKEAAEFLNVSEMTIRRWTNQGSLKCYRVGGRRARRFKPEDLTAYLEGRPSATDSLATRSNNSAISFPDGCHITHLSRCEDEALETDKSFIADGIGRGETICVVVPEDKCDRIMDALRRNEAIARKMRVPGGLHVSRGMETPESQANYILDLATRSGGRFRVFGDMKWTKKKGWSAEEIFRLEDAVNRSARYGEGSLLCQYALDSFSGAEIMNAIETHSHSIYREQVKENPFK